MKRQHFLLILLLVGITAYFLNETRILKSTEANARTELDMLRTAVKKSSGASSTFAGKSTTARQPAIDPGSFSADLSDILKGGTDDEIRKGLEEFQKRYEVSLNATSLSKLKEICSILEKDFPFDQKGSETAHRVWSHIVSLAAKSDPAWAFAKFEEVAFAFKVPIDAALSTFKRWGSENGEPMNPAYANALQKWLDAAQAEGKIEAGNPLVAQLRAEIAAAQGNQSAAVKQISLLPHTSQQKAAIDYVASLQTPDERRQAMEEFSTALHFQNFEKFASALAENSGFDAAKDLLASAKLTPESHDLAAASIATAKIGPDTNTHAAWLLETLRSDNPRALHNFADQWAHADYNEAARWMNTIPAGAKRDAAVSGFAPVAAKIDGASAADWAHSIADPLQRNRTLSEVRSIWREQDAAAADAYYKEKPFDPASLEAGTKDSER